MKDSNKRFSVINQHGMALVVKNTKEEAEQEANRMSDYHSETFTVSEY